MTGGPASRQFWNPALGILGTRLQNLITCWWGCSFQHQAALWDRSWLWDQKPHRLGLIRNLKANPCSPATGLWAFGSSSGVLSILPFRWNVPTFFASSLGNVVSNVYSLGLLSNLRVKTKAWF